MNNIFKYFLYILFGFIVLRLPHGTPLLAKVFDISIILGFVITIICSIQYYPTLKQSTKGAYVFLVGLPVFLIISRLMNGYSLTMESIVRGFMYPIMLINLFTIIMSNDLWGKLKAIDFILTTFVFINFINVILYPNGWYSSQTYDLNWFLGYKNVMIRTLLPALIINAILAFHEYGKLRAKNIILYIICLLTTLFSQSSTSLVMIVLYGLLIIAVPIIKKIKYYSLTTVFLIHFILAVAIVLFNFQERYASFFEEELDRDVTFTGRTFIWEYGLIKVLQSPIIGYGYHSGLEWNKILGDFGSLTLSHPHNFLLYSLLEGGIVYLGLYIVLLIYITVYTWKQRQSLELYLLTTMYFVFFIGGISESLTECPLMLPMLGLFITIFNYKREYENNRISYTN